MLLRTLYLGQRVMELRHLPVCSFPEMTLLFTVQLFGRRRETSVRLVTVFVELSVVHIGLGSSLDSTDTILIRERRGTL